jgi:hypothetical protein
MGGRAPARPPEPRRPLAARAGPTPVVMDFVVRSCYDRPMRAFVCEVDHTGLHRLVPEDLVPGDELRRLARPRASRPTTLVWALLHNCDAEAIRSRVATGGHADARGLLLNRAVELISLGTATPALPAGQAA